MPDDIEMFYTQFQTFWRSQGNRMRRMLARSPPNLIEDWT